MSEANRTVSIPHIAWFHPGTGYNPLQPTHINADAGVLAIPLQSVAPLPLYDLSHNDSNITIQHPKAKKPKTSKKTSRDVASMSLEPPPKQTKKDPTKSSKKTKASYANNSTTPPVAKRERKDLNFVSYGGSVDLSGIPSPFCSCTGVTRQCYRWGAGGWQSSCCTTNISEYPLPMSVKRPGSRMAGRKMSSGAYEKLLQRLAAEGYDLSHPIDLREHWARHGTNKFVTIK